MGTFVQKIVLDVIEKSMSYKTIYQLCQTVDGKDIVIRESNSEKHLKSLTKKSGYFIRVKRVKNAPKS